jgi:AbrB family looped-hinge helix DNA binding protein
MAWYYAIMNDKVTIDKAGRIVLPKPLRDELRIAAGDTLDLETTGEEITLRPARGSAPLRKKHGVWVYRSGEPLSARQVEETRRRVRRERESRVSGEDA